MARTVPTIVAFALLASAAAATVTDVVQDDFGTGGDASDEPWAPTQIVGPQASTWEGSGLLVPVDDPRDFYAIDLSPGAEPAFGNSFTITVVPAPYLDAAITLGIPPYGVVLRADAGGPGEPETIHVPPDLAVPGPYVVGTGIAPPCVEGVADSPACKLADGVRTPLGTMADNYVLHIHCEPFCP